MPDFTKEQKLIIELLKPSPEGDFAVPSDIDWDLLYKEALSQAVIGAVAKRIKESDIAPSDVISKFTGAYYQQISANIKAAEVQREMIKTLDGRYPYLVIKGFASAEYWPYPETRATGDCDFLINASDREELTRLFETKGYEADKRVCHHVAFRKGRSEIEMHTEVNGVPDGHAGEIIRAFLKSVLNDFRIAETNGAEYRAPSPKYHALIIVLHMQHHMTSRGIGLRHLLDFGYFVDKTCGESFWEEELVPLFKSTGLLTFAATMAKTCSIFFDTACPEWAKNADENLCGDVMEDVLSGGNFGRKNAARSQSGRMIANPENEKKPKGKLRTALHLLHSSTPAVYPVVKKQKWLHPFLDFWRVIVFYSRVITGKRRSLTDMAGYADERKSVYDRLRLFETSDE